MRNQGLAGKQQPGLQCRQQLGALSILLRPRLSPRLDLDRMFSLRSVKHIVLSVSVGQTHSAQGGMGPVGADAATSHPAPAVT